ncbi:response regulator transcription factor [Microbacterium immunditiarum]|uniref:DNA-binding NarL/FixJ family response regulator n=1 Tax=Microbacterium immunditiarum TaxID=337480 RepID=A0A7Y9KHR7_9MICO|nr:response regulator transcription factor [Microbacterium immunditiarum]NYE17980.1 DNA-binding NarL/FixJ family response regulator [Microbacterium immunditiarum]
MTARPTPIRVLIADDNRSVRKGLRLQLESAGGVQVLGEVSNGADAVTVARRERADVVLMDLQMPGLSGVEATRELVRSTEPPIAVIVMTSYAIDAYVTEALDAGAIGYLLKSHDSDQLLTAIRAAVRGEALLSGLVTAPVLREFARRGATDHLVVARLSTAERRVVSVLSSGTTSNDQIAERLSVSVHTVRSQLHSALKKVGVEDRTQLALWGARNHLDRDADSLI